jgi:uncharacterized protein with GYD domain
MPSGLNSKPGPLGPDLYLCDTLAEKGERRTVVATFFLFGNYNVDAIREMSIERTTRVVSEIEKLGGKVLAMHALLGPFDLCFCVKLPGIEEAMKASVTLTRLTGITFTTCPAVTVETFDRIVGEPSG